MRWVVELSPRWALRNRANSVALARLRRPHRAASLAFLPTQAPAEVLEACAILQHAGIDTVCHLPARRFRDAAETAAFARELHAIGVREVLALRGDGEGHGWGQGVDAVRAARDAGVPRVGVAAYPEGHATVPDAVLREALKRKLQLAGASAFAVTQLTLSPDHVLPWLDAQAPLPVRVGIFGPISTARVKSLSTRLSFGRGLLAQAQALDGPAAVQAASRKVIAAASHRASGFQVTCFDRVSTTLDWLDDLASPPQPSRSRSRRGT